jgi:hypothetical protein
LISTNSNNCDQDHVFDLYTKQGDVFQYSSLIVFAPDWEVGFVVLAAGNSTTVTVDSLGDAIIHSLFPALEETARSQAQSKFAGTYVSNDTSVPSNITLTTQPGEPGLVITEWYSNATDFLAVLAYVQTSSLNDSAVDVRLYPSGLNQQIANSTERVGYRAAIAPVEPQANGAVFTMNCYTDDTTDELMYGGVGIDEFEFRMENGKVVSITPRALRATLKKVP